MKHPIIYSFVTEPNMCGDKKIRYVTDPNYDGVGFNAEKTATRVAWSTENLAAYPSCHCTASKKGQIKRQGRLEKRGLDHRDAEEASTMNWLVFG